MFNRFKILCVRDGNEGSFHVMKHLFIAEIRSRQEYRPPYKCIADETCSYIGSQRFKTVKHVLKNHVDKSRVPHGCSLCRFRCDSLGMLKGHRSWYGPHVKAMKRAAASGNKINEDKEEYHSSNPVNLEELIKRVDCGEYL